MAPVSQHLHHALSILKAPTSGHLNYSSDSDKLLAGQRRPCAFRLYQGEDKTVTKASHSRNCTNWRKRARKSSIQVQLHLSSGAGGPNQTGELQISIQRIGQSCYPSHLQIRFNHRYTRICWHSHVAYIYLPLKRRVQSFYLNDKCHTLVSTSKLAR